ncbi:MAG: EamA family transporter [Gammaproteobacteria bacterium]|nr:MAG: EamA family transporter [Gammaproteobacteria bacterium]
MNKRLLGFLYATVAAALNGTIGIFSTLLLHSRLNSNDVAFLKTLIAALILGIFLCKTSYKKQRESIINNYPAGRKFFWLKVAVCAFLGIFISFYFETSAYNYGNASDVVIVLMASAAVSSLLFGFFLLRERLSFSALSGAALAIAGVFVTAWIGGNNHLLLFNSAVAGATYGLFSVLVKKFKFAGGLFLTHLLLIFGAMYLFIPFVSTFHTIALTPPILAGLVCLAVFPTILGFYCTIKSLQYIAPSKVQVTELSEPIFSMLFAWCFLSQIPTPQFFIGSVFIIVGILLMNGFIGQRQIQ